MNVDYIINNMDLQKYQKKFEFLVKILGNTTNIVEIGAHYGEDSVRFNHFFPDANIYCFEPDPRNIEIFKKTCQNIDKITLIEKAVSNTDNTELSFYQIYIQNSENVLQDKYKYIGLDDYKTLKLSGSGASSLKQPSRNDLNIHNKIVVNTIRLDTWVKENNINIIDFIWIDVQGAEKEVIEGCKNILNKIKFIQLEYGETSYEGGLSKKATYDMMINNNFELISDYNPNSNNGDYLFKNKMFNP